LLRRPISAFGLGLAGLYSGSLAINVAGAWALGATQVLSGEETSVSLRDPFFLDLRQQYDTICTNIAAHIFYWLGQRLVPEPSLFFGRYQKALAMSLVPVFVALYLARQREMTPPRALLTAALLALMPGFFLFAPLATEYGLECVTGMAALWLAGSERAALRWLAVPLASWTALTYGAGLAFVPAIAWQLFTSERGVSMRRILALTAGFALPWLVPFVIWKNHPHLLTGGGTFSSLQALVHHLGQLAWEASVRGGSYYYFAEYPALSQPLLALAALAAVAWFALRREHLPLLVGFSGAVFIYLASGRFIGMRRGVPIVLFAIMLLGLAWPVLLRRVRIPVGGARAAVALSFVICAAELSSTYARFASGTWRVPLDFDFRVLQGATMPETYRYLLEHPDAISAEYEPERTWAVLHFLARREGPFSRDAIAKRLRVPSYSTTSSYSAD
jgi:hypothetical protein